MITSVRESDNTRLFALIVCDGFVQAYIRLFGLSYLKGSVLVWQSLTWERDDLFTLEVHRNSRYWSTYYLVLSHSSSLLRT